MKSKKKVSSGSKIPLIILIVLVSGVMIFLLLNYLGIDIFKPLDPIVTPENHAPTITSTFLGQINENAVYNYDVNANDADEDTLTYSLVNPPTWLAINSQTGVITGTAPAVTADVSISMNVKVSDGELEATQSYTLIVKNLDVNQNISTDITVPGGAVARWKLNDLYFEDSIGTSTGQLAIPMPNAYSGMGSSVDGMLDNAVSFNGDECVEFVDDNKFSIPTTGQITVSMWINPSNFDFVGEAENYIHFAGKADWMETPQYEWQFRLYNAYAFDEVSRAKRVSFYVFNLAGGLGVGSYFQDNLQENEWIHVVGVADGDKTLIYKNGILRDTDNYRPGLSTYVDIIPGNGMAPVRLGCADEDSSFEGAIDDVIIFNRALSGTEIKHLYDDYIE